MLINLIKSLFIHMFTYWIVVLPDFVEGCSLLGAKQHKMYALTLGMGDPGLLGPPGSVTEWFTFLDIFVTLNIYFHKTCAISNIYGIKYPRSFKRFTETGTELSVDFSYCWINLVEAWYSLEQYIGLKEDKLSSTTVDFIRSEGNLETKHLYWFSKPKMC